MRVGVIAALAVATIAAQAGAEESAERPPTWSLEATYTAEGWRLAGGDLRSHSAYLDNVDLIATVDGEALFGVSGLQLFVYALYDNGHALNDGIADTIQGISNIEAPRAFRMYEAWAQWQLASLVSLRAGLYDVNSEFDAIEGAGLFVNPSHGIGPDFSQSGLNGPSIFPVTSVGARVRVELERWHVQLAVLDAVPGDPARPNRTAVRWDSSEGLLYVGEVNHRTSGDVRFGIGYWRYSEAFDTFAPDSEQRPRAANEGGYVFAETPAIGIPRGALRAFSRAGWANADVNTVASYVGAGMTWAGLMRNEDEIGIAIGRARVGEPWRRAQQLEGIETGHVETIVELTARMALGDRFVVQPDVQYVRQPGALRDRQAFWAFGLRIELALALAR